MTTSNSSTPAVRIVNITDSHAGQRIDNFLLNLEKGVPKSRIYRALRKGEVRVNKGRVKPTYKVCSGDAVRVPPLRSRVQKKITHIDDQLANDLEQQMLFEDDHMLAINKPAGLAVHGGSGIQLGMIEALRVMRPESSFLELVHRLDRETSGCLLVAKTRQALLDLQNQLRAHAVDKFYLTLLKKGWTRGERLCEQPLVKNTVEGGERMVAVSPTGKNAKTRFIPLEQLAGAQLTEVELFTGRTHQIRVHSAYLGCPVAADSKYGDKAWNKTLRQQGLKRQFLHAACLRLHHPADQRPLELNAPLADDLQFFLDTMKHL